MQIHDNLDDAFAPLISFLQQELGTTHITDVLQNYMYMYHDHTYHYYKHTLTRQYIVIDADGTLIQGGIHFE